MRRSIDAVLVPHASGLLSEAFGECFGGLRRALDRLRTELAADRPGLVVLTSSEALSAGPFRLLSAPLFAGDLKGGSVSSLPFAHPGLDAELVRSLVRRLRLAGIDSEAAFYEPLDFASAAALHLALRSEEGPPILPVAVPPDSLRSGFRFGSVLAELLAEREIDALWIAAGALSHRSSKEAESVREEGEPFDRELLDSFSRGEIDPLIDLSPRALVAVAADAGLAHLAPLLGFLGDGYRTELLAYGGIFGAGNAVVRFRRGGRPTRELELAGVGSSGGTEKR